MRQWECFKVWFSFMFLAGIASLQAVRNPPPRSTRPDYLRQRSLEEKGSQGRVHFAFYDELPEEQDRAWEEDQIVRVGIHAKVESKQDFLKFFNPYTAWEKAHLSTVVNLHEGFFYHKGSSIVMSSGRGAVHGSKDLMTWELSIAPESRWSDGTPVRAEDFILGLRTLYNPETYTEASFGAPAEIFESMLRRLPIQNGMAIFRGELPVEALGATSSKDNSLCLKLERPMLGELLMAQLTSPYFCPLRQEHLDFFRTKDFNQLTKLPFCAGFTIAEWNYPNQIVLKKSPYYYGIDRTGSLEEVRIEIRDNMQELLELWDKGQIDYCLVDQRCVELSEQQREHLWDAKVVGYEAIWLNHTHPELKKKEVRRALSLLLNGERMIKSVPFSDTKRLLLGLFSANNELVKKRPTEEKTELEKGYPWNLSQKERLALARKLLESARGEGEADKVIRLTLQYRAPDRCLVNGLLKGLESFSDLIEITPQQVDQFQGTDFALRFFDTTHRPHISLRFSALRHWKDEEGKTIENPTGFDHEGFNQILETLESGVGVPYSPHEDLTPSWVYQKLCALDQIACDEVAIIPLREKLAQFLAHPEVGGLPRADYYRFNKGHHYSGVPYFKRLYLKKPHEEYRAFSPNTGRK